MRHEEFVECMSKFFGMPPFAIETANYRIVVCDCGKTHNRDMFGKGCPGWTTELKTAKELAKERKDFDYDEHTRQVRAWRRKHGYRPTQLEGGKHEASSERAEERKTVPPAAKPVSNVFASKPNKKEHRRGR